MFCKGAQYSRNSPYLHGFSPCPKTGMMYISRYVAGMNGIYMARQNILVIKLGALGDFVLSLGVFAALRAQHPHARITVLTTAPFQEMAQKSGFFDDVWVIRRWNWKQLGAWWGFARQLRAAKFDCVYDLQRNDRTGLFYRLAPAVTRECWLGFHLPKGSSPCLYGRAGEIPPDVLRIEDARDFKMQDIGWMNGDIARFELPARYALLVPGCAPQHPQKKWPAAHFVALAKKMLAQDITPAIIGGPAEKELAAEIMHDAVGTISLVGKTGFFDIASIAQGACAAVGNDTGPMHLISASGVPSLWLFSGTSNPVQSAPKGDHINVLRQHNIADIPVADVWRVFETIKRA